MKNLNPIVTITMEDGSIIKVELYPEIAPNTVANFISLVKKGFYDGLTFHRVIRGFMIQGDVHKVQVQVAQVTILKVNSVEMVYKTT